MHADVTRDGAIDLVLTPDDQDTDRRVAVEAAAAVLVALARYREGDRDAANQTLRHAVHGDVPPMALLLAGAHLAAEVDAIVASDVQIAAATAPDGALRLTADRRAR